ncbi:hypothetical protein [Streptomyces eurythermus]
MEAAIAGAVFLAVLGLLAWTLLRHRGGHPPAGAAERAERPRLEAYHVAALAAFAVFLVAWTA